MFVCVLAVCVCLSAYVRTRSLKRTLGCSVNFDGSLEAGAATLAGDL